MILKIPYKGINLVIYGDYTEQKYGNRETPPDAEKFEIKEIHCCSNIIELLESLELIEDIEKLCLEEINKY